MKQIFLFFCLFCFTSTEAQELPYYSKINKILWKTDTLFASTDNLPFNISNIEVMLSPITYSCHIMVQNNTDKPIKVNWSNVIIKYCGKSMMIRLSEMVLKDEQQQIQEIPKKGKVWQGFDAIYGEKVVNLREAKKTYNKKKEPVPVKLEVSFPIIYNDEEIIIHKIDYGLYDPQYKE